MIESRRSKSITACHHVADFFWLRFWSIKQWGDYTTLSAPKIDWFLRDSPFATVISIMLSALCSACLKLFEKYPLCEPAIIALVSLYVYYQILVVKPVTLHCKSTTWFSKLLKKKMTILIEPYKVWKNTWSLKKMQKLIFFLIISADHVVFWIQATDNIRKLAKKIYTDNWIQSRSKVWVCVNTIGCICFLI